MLRLFRTRLAILSLCLSCLTLPAQSVDLPIVRLGAPEGVFAEYYAPYSAISLQRFGDLSEPLEVKYTVSGEAKNGEDYARLSGSVTIPAHEYMWTLLLNAEDDPITEDPESIEVSLIHNTAPFTLAILPDTQWYTANSYGGTPEMFSAQTQWIVDNKDAKNIAFVLHEGDCTQENNHTEWQRTKASMSLLDGVVPYAIALGNHDGFISHQLGTDLFNEFFPLADYEGLPTFGGVFESNRMDNCYHFFNSGGLDWLVLSLEFGPRDEVLDWANTVVAAHPHRRVIIVIHTHVFFDDTLHGSSPFHPWKPTEYGRQNNGTHVWEKLVRPHANISFVFNGHVVGDGLGRVVGIGDHGNRVYQMLCNYQGRANGGSGFLRYITFYPEEDRLEAKTFSPVLNRFLTDPENEFEYHELGIFTNIARTYTIDENHGSVSIELLSDEIDTTPPSPAGVTAAGNPAEITVVFDEPLHQETAEAIANYSINAPSALITNATLAADWKTVLLSCNTSLAPLATYTLTVNGVKDRTYQSNEMNAPISRPFIYFPVLFSDDFTGTNFSHWTIVDEGAVDFPSIWSIVNGCLFQYANIYSPPSNATTNASRKGTFAHLNKPLSFNWKNYAVSATLNNGDDDGIGLMFRYQNRSNYYKLDFDAQNRFRRLTRMVNGVERQLARETAPFPVGRDVKLRVTAYGNQITITLDGVPVFGGPITDSSLTSGTIALYCWFNSGARFDDIVVTTENPVPQVSITSPSHNAEFAYGVPIPITVSASDVDGIAKVEVFEGNVLIKTLTNAPFHFNWVNVPAGKHLLSARASDIFDAIGNSAPIEIESGIGPPGFLLQPQDQVVGVGQSVLFRARALGAPPLHYQWLYNEMPISGATNQLLFFNDAQQESAGAYSVRVSGPTATVISSPAFLSVVHQDTILATNAVPILSVEDMEFMRPPLLSVQGPLGLLQVEFSTNLQTWMPLTALTNRTGRVFFNDPANTLSGFYRAIAVPE